MSRIQYPKNSTNVSDYRDGHPYLFTICKAGSVEPLYDVALALYVNPSSVDEQYTKNKSVVMTYGGYVEFVWPDDLDSISGNNSTGGFISPRYGYTAAPSKAPGSNGELTGRRGTLAYERYLDFLELFRSNGMIFDQDGTPQIRGGVLLICDRGVYRGHFTSFTVNEEESAPFAFSLSWEFKVESSVYKFGTR